MDAGGSSGYGEYLAGWVAGVATVAIGHPFDTVKVKLQKHNTGVVGLKYRNSLHCAGRILMSEGVKGTYRWVTPSFVGVANKEISTAREMDQPQPRVIIPSSAYGGAVVSFVLCPSELVKCRMQVQGADSVILSSTRYSGPLNCALKTVKDEGVTGLFRGVFTTFLQESIGNVAFFTIYENVRHYMNLSMNADTHASRKKYLVDAGIGIASGGLGGIAFWLTILPLDVAKTIIRTYDRNSTRNPFLVLYSIYNGAGLKGCYTGLGPIIVRAFPANAAAILTWELAMNVLRIAH